MSILFLFVFSSSALLFLTLASGPLYKRPFHLYLIGGAILIIGYCIHELAIYIASNHLRDGIDLSAIRLEFALNLFAVSLAAFTAVLFSNAFSNRLKQRYEKEMSFQVKFMLSLRKDIFQAKTIADKLNDKQQCFSDEERTLLQNQGDSMNGSFIEMCNCINELEKLNPDQNYGVLLSDERLLNMFLDKHEVDALLAK